METSSHLMTFDVGRLHVQTTIPGETVDGLVTLVVSGIIENEAVTIDVKLTEEELMDTIKSTNEVAEKHLMDSLKALKDIPRNESVYREGNE